MDKKQISASSTDVQDHNSFSGQDLKRQGLDSRFRRRLKRRHLFEAVFKAISFSAVCFAGLMLAVLIGNIAYSSLAGFQETRIKIDIYLEPELFALPETLTSQSTMTLLNRSENQKDDRAAYIRRMPLREILFRALQDHFPDVQSRKDRNHLYRLLSTRAREELAEYLIAHPDSIGQTVSIAFTASDAAVQILKRQSQQQAEGEDQPSLNLSDREDNHIQWLNQLKSQGRVTTGFSTSFLTNGDSSEPELAGILGAAVGSGLTLIVTLFTALPLGVFSAVYLEEFAEQNWFTGFLEVNINNMAAVPSIIYGLLGLFLFIELMNLPRSSPLVGGLTLALMTLPTIIIASRAAIRSVPVDIRTAAYALGASRMQVVFHHIFPSALPGIMTGSIIGMSRALGETAPLLMIGMVAFIVSVPSGLTDPATVLPVQIYLWSDGSEKAFIEKTASAIMVLLVFLIAMNAVAIWIRQRFEKTL